MMPARTAELLGRLSLAFDVANDSPYGKAVRSVVLAVELGALAGADDEQLRDTYWLSLFAYLGSTAFAHESMFSMGDPLASIIGVAQRITPNVPLGTRVRAVAGMGENLALPIRLHQIAHVVEIAHHRHGRAGAAALFRRRSNRQFDLQFSKILLDNQTELFAAIEDPEIFDRFLGLEPKPVMWADARRMDDLARALAIFVDLKCPIFVGHSTGVAALAGRAAVDMDLGKEEIQALRWAALLHDIGRLGVPNAIWERPGPLDWGQWERVRLHAYYTERVLSPIAALAPVTEIAVAAHERIDGSGYHHRRSGRALAAAPRLLAAADMAFAMSEDRPHRRALDAAAIARELVTAAGEGYLDATAVDAVLASLGVETRVAPSSLNGLSERELDVSRLLARGKTNKDIAELLGISVRTVHNHVAHIFDKLGVHSRSGAAIWLMEHNFLN